MASKHTSLQMGEVADVIILFRDFEAQNRVILECRLSSIQTRGTDDLLVSMWAHQEVKDSGDLECLGSVSVRCLDTGLRNLRDVVTHALYALDFKLALDEFAAVKRKDA